MSRRGSLDEGGREEEMRKDGGDLRLDSPELGESTYTSS